MNDDRVTVDRRVMKTKKAIRNAFAELLSEKNLADITVTDIANRADINRKTFYNYYSGIHEAVEEIEDEIVVEFEQSLADVDFNVAMSKPAIIFQKLGDLIGNDHTFYGNLLLSQYSTSFVDKTVHAIISRAKKSIGSQIDIDEDLLDAELVFVVSGMVSVYKEWFRNNHGYSMEALSAFMGNMSYNGANGFHDGDLVRFKI